MRFLNRESGVDYFDDKPYYISLRSPAHEYFRNEFRSLYGYDDRGFIITNDTIIPERKKSFVKGLHVFFQNIRKNKDESFKIKKGTDAYAYFVAEHRSNIQKDCNGNIIVPTVKIMQKVI